MRWGAREGQSSLFAHCHSQMTASRPPIIMRDWCRKPPLRLRATTKLHICWSGSKCQRWPHMREVAIAPWVIRLGSGRLAGHAAPARALHGVRQGSGAAASGLGRTGHWMADQPDGAEPLARLMSLHLRQRRRASAHWVSRHYKEWIRSSCRGIPPMRRPRSVTAPTERAPWRMCIHVRACHQCRE
jgi:hypothetical protein